MDYLYHHGIKGMRWGVRRFQNEDGSLTAAGRKRYDVIQDLERKIDDYNKNSKVQKHYEKYGYDDEELYNDIYDEKGEEAYKKAIDKYNTKLKKAEAEDAKRGYSQKQDNENMSDLDWLQNGKANKKVARIGGAVVGGIILGPLGGKIAGAVTDSKSAKTQVLAVLGTIGGLALAGYTIGAVGSAKKEKQVYSKYGLSKKEVKAMNKLEKKGG